MKINFSDYPKNKMVAIRLKHIPCGNYFRYDSRWWFHIKVTSRDMPENAVSVDGSIELMVIPPDTIIATHIDEVPKSMIGKSQMLF